jgi:hypothetical protein
LTAEWPLPAAGMKLFVPSGTQKQILDEKGELIVYKKDERVPHLSKFPYLYLKYKSHYQAMSLWIQIPQL